MNKPPHHDYEAFLATHHPDLRRAHGVYYTPEPVASYIVRSVESLLQTHLSVASGFRDPAVAVVDPACGTGVFLSAVLQHIRAHFIQQHDVAGWQHFVASQLSRTLWGCELLAEPATIAQQLLASQIMGHDLPEDIRERWACPVTECMLPYIQQGNALDTPSTDMFPPLDQPHATTTRNIPVILGNPPYQGHSTNKGSWIYHLLRGKLPDGTSVASYYEVDGQPLRERNVKWLQDDYVKFVRLAQWWIEQQGRGILGFVCNNGFLDNPTFRGMRQQLMRAFDHIYLLDLHGNARKREKTPDGSRDENVFDILQGVVILLAVRSSPCISQNTLWYSELWGLREEKLARLKTTDITSTPWQELSPVTPFYFFVPHSTKHSESYAEGWKVTDIFPVHSVGVATARDRLTIHWTPEEARETAQHFASLPVEEARSFYHLGKDVRDWKVAWAQEDLRQNGLRRDNIQPILYRPMDYRYTCYTGKTRGFHCMPRAEVMGHLLAGDNLALITSRMTKGESFHHVQASRTLVEVICMSSKTSNNGFVFPLYLYPNHPFLSDTQRARYPTWTPGINGRLPNLSPAFVKALETRLGLRFVSEEEHTEHRAATLSPMDILAYLYAVLHTPRYRERYAAFLQVDFPRIPLPASSQQFRRLGVLGRRLLALHLFEADDILGTEPQFPIPGENLVEKGYPRYTPGQTPDDPGQVWLNSTQYWTGIPSQVWAYQIGGYQVCRKWLQSRRGRALTAQEISQFQRIIATLQETIALVHAICRVIRANS